MQNGLVGVWLDRPAARRHEIPAAEISAAREAGVLVVGSVAEVPGVLGLG